MERFGTWCTAALAILSMPVVCGASWSVAKTEHFTLYSNSNEATTRELVNQFVLVRQAMRTALTWAGPQEKPLRIIAFDTKKDMEPYAPSELTAGYFLPGESDDFVVVAIPSVTRRVIAHEYCHIILAQNGLHLPAWLNEGIAEVYSNFSATKTRLIYGEFPEGGAQALSPGGWVPLDTLLSADPSDPLFESPAMLRSSHAESWLLTHMLAFDPRYAPRWGNLIAASAKSKGPDVLTAVYGKSLRQIEADLKWYLQTGCGNRLRLSLSEPRGANSVDLEQGANLGARMALADILCHYLGRDKQAREAYDSLERDYPEEPTVELGIAKLCIRSGNSSEAEEHRVRAANLVDDGRRVSHEVSPTVAGDTALIHETPGKNRDR